LAEEERLELAYPGDELYQQGRPKKTKLSTWVADQRWSALSVKDGVLFVEPVTATTESDLVSVSGKNADRLLQGKALKHPPKPTSGEEASTVAAAPVSTEAEETAAPGELPPA
jgi:hypothetical protein